MTAGMHFAGVLRGVGEARRLADRKGVHVGAQCHCRAGRGPFDDADEPVAADLLVNRDAECFQPVPDEPCGPDFLKRKLRMGVQGVAVGNQRVDVGFGESVHRCPRIYVSVSSEHPRISLR